MSEEIVVDAARRLIQLRRQERERQELKDHYVMCALFWFQTLCCGWALVATLFSPKPDWFAVATPVGGQLICLYYINRYVREIRKS